MQKQKFNILIVDDDLVIIGDIGRAIANHFPKVDISIANNGLKALEILEEEPIDLILSDIQMNKLDGYEMAKRIKSNPKHEDIPIIFISSLDYGDKEDKIIEGISIGRIDLIQKPINKTLLLNKLENYIKLFESKKETEQILNSQSSLIVISNGSETIKVNQQFLNTFGYESFKDFKSKHKSVSELFIKKDNNELQPFVNGVSWIEYIFKDKNQTYLAYMKDKDEEERVFKVITSPDKGFVDFNDSYVITFIDITNLKKEQNKILQEQAKFASMGEMMDMILHQWNQPLTVIGTVVAKLKIAKEIGSLDGKVIDSGINRINTSIDFLEKTVSNFRSFFNNKGIKKEISLKELTSNVYLLIEPSLKGKEISFSQYYNNCKDSDVISSYPCYIDQVLLSIYKNSIDAFSIKNIKNPQIEVLSSIIDEKLILEIQDNAGGISDDIIAKIFEQRFTTKESIGGTGLGLSIVKSIVEDKLKGNINVYNKNSGICFKIELNLKEN